MAVQSSYMYLHPTCVILWAAAVVPSEVQLIHKELSVLKEGRSAVQRLRAGGSCRHTLNCWELRASGCTAGS